MKKVIFFICNLILSFSIIYLIGQSMAGTPDISKWTTNGQNYFIALVINVTMFGTLWMIEQPWAQRAKTKKAYRIRIAKIYIYKYWQLIKQPK